MKNLVLATLLLFGLNQTYGQQVTPHKQATEIARWNVRLYPLAAITNLRAEVGYRLNERWEANLLGSWYYEKIFWYRTPKSQLATPFYVPTQGAQVFLSVEQRRPKDLISIGARIGYRGLQSQPFDVKGDFEADKQTVVINQKRTDLLCIVRVKSKHKGVFVEFIAQGGLSYVILTENVTHYLSDGSPHYELPDRIPYWWPALNVGFNIGFGW
jgi:hypothetical protein